MTTIETVTVTVDCEFDAILKSNVLHELENMEELEVGNIATNKGAIVTKLKSGKVLRYNKNSKGDLIRNGKICSHEEFELLMMNIAKEETEEEELSRLFNEASKKMEEAIKSASEPFVPADVTIMVSEDDVVSVEEFIPNEETPKETPKEALPKEGLTTLEKVAVGLATTATVGLGGYLAWKKWFS